MATFPTLSPSTRLITPAEDQFQPHPTMNGIYDATLLCGSPRNQQIDMTFDALSTADKDLIVDHYDGQQSGIRSGWWVRARAQRERVVDLASH